MIAPITVVKREREGLKSNLKPASRNLPSPGLPEEQSRALPVLSSKARHQSGTRSRPCKVLGMLQPNVFSLLQKISWGSFVLLSLIFKNPHNTRGEASQTILRVSRA